MVFFTWWIDNEGDEENDIPDRETLKRYTTQMLNARMKAKQPKQQKKKKGDLGGLKKRMGDDE